MIIMYLKEDIMKKILICGIAVLLLTTGCGKIAKLENGQDAVVTLSNGAISVDDLYAQVKDQYALNSLTEMMDRKILTEKYGEELLEDEKEQVESQISTWIQTFGNEQQLLAQTQSAFGVSTMDGLREYLSLQYRRNQAIEDYVKENISDIESVIMKQELDTKDNELKSLEDRVKDIQNQIQNLMK